MEELLKMEDAEDNLSDEMPDEHSELSQTSDLENFT